MEIKIRATPDWLKLRLKSPLAKIQNWKSSPRLGLVKHSTSNVSPVNYTSSLSFNVRNESFTMYLCISTTQKAVLLEVVSSYHEIVFKSNKKNNTRGILGMTQINPNVHVHVEPTMQNQSSVIMYWWHMMCIPHHQKTLTTYLIYAKSHSQQRNTGILKIETTFNFKQSNSQWEKLEL